MIAIWHSFTPEPEATNFWQQAELHGLKGLGHLNIIKHEKSALLPRAYLLCIWWYMKVCYLTVIFFAGVVKVRQQSTPRWTKDTALKYRCRRGIGCGLIVCSLSQKWSWPIIGKVSGLPQLCDCWTWASIQISWCLRAQLLLIALTIRWGWELTNRKDRLFLFFSCARRWENKA